MNNKKRTNQKITINRKALEILREFDQMECDVDAFFEVANTLLKREDLSKANSQKIKKSMRYFLDSVFEKSPNLLIESLFRNSYKNFQRKETE